MKILIIEDDAKSAKFIEDTLNKQYSYDHCINHVSTVEQAVSILLENKVDIVLFKLNLKSGSCFDILDKIPEKSFKSIFITDNLKEDEVINAVKYAAHDFLHNPLNSDALIKSVDAAIEKITEELELQKMGVILSLREKNKNTQESIHLQLLNGSTKKIPVSEIMYLEGDGAVTYIHLIKEKHTLPKNIGCFKDFLIEDFGFRSISKSILFNIKHLKSYNHQKLEINLKNGLKLTASRRGGKEFKEFLNNFQADDLVNVLSRS